MKNNAILFVIIFLSVTLIVQAQPGRGSGKYANMKIAELSGRIIDSSTGEPMPFANVVVYRLKDSSIVSGTIAEEDGTFLVDKMPFGKFYAEFKFIGYESNILDDIMLTPKQKSLDLGDVQLLPASVQTGEIEVTAEKQSVEYKVDRKIININQDIVSSSGTAVDALERAPSVEVDIEGNVSLRGSSNFTVFINGKPTVLTGTDALQQIPVSSIAHIELITNPSAKYDPDGLAGIINVVLKENNLKGLSGMGTISAGVNDKYKLDLNLSYGLKDLNLYAGFSYDSFVFLGEGKSITDYFEPTNKTLSQEMNGRHTREGLNFKTGAEYHFSRELSMKIEGGYGTFLYARSNRGNLSNFDKTLNTSLYTISESDISRDNIFYNVNYNLTYLLGRNGHKIDFLAYYSKSTGDDDDYQQEELSNISFDERYDPVFGIISEEADDGQNMRFSLDYTLPINEKTKFEAGLQTRIDAEDNDYDFTKLDTNSGEFVYNDFFSNNLNFDRSIHSVYATFNSNLFGIDYMLGLRAEYTDRTTAFPNKELDFNINRIDFFPSLHFTKKFEGMHQLMASYSRRINRPRGRWLDPFPTYRDSYNYHIGNPELEPEYTDSYEIGYQKIFENLTISVEGYYRYTENEFERYREQDSSGIIYHTAINLSNESSLGVEMMINYQPFKWLNLGIVPNFYKYSIEGDMIADDATTSTNTWNMRFFGDIKITKDLRFEVKSYVRGNRITSQGEREGFYTVDLGLRYDFLDRRASLVLSGRNIFDTAKREMETTTETFYTYDKFQREGQIFTLTFSYRFNQYKKDRQGRGNGSGNGEDFDSDFF